MDLFRRYRLALIVVAVLVGFALAVAGHISQPFYSVREATAPLPVSPEKLRADVTKLTTEFVPRDSLHPEILDKAAAWIRSELEPTGATVSEQLFSLGGGQFRNVIAAYGPLTPERIIVTAHYDAAKGFPGADDDASGVAVLLELARQLKDVKLSTRVELVAVSLEEVSHTKTALNGSGAYAKDLAEHGEKVRAMISLEMLGCYSDEPGSQRFPAGFLSLIYPSTGNYAVIVGNMSSPELVRKVKGGFDGATTLPVKSINAPQSVPGIGWSDHASFWKQGYPAVMITDTAFYRNKRYHTAEDTAETLDYARMAEVAKGVYGAVLALDGG